MTPADGDVKSGLFQQLTGHQKVGLKIYQIQEGATKEKC
jgi:hypothetical protein